MIGSFDHVISSSNSLIGSLSVCRVTFSLQLVIAAELAQVEDFAGDQGKAIVSVLLLL